MPEKESPSLLSRAFDDIPLLMKAYPKSPFHVSFTPPPAMNDNGEELEEEEDENDIYDLVAVPEFIRADWFISLISLQADLIYNTLLVLTSPITLFLSLAHRSYKRAAAAATAAEEGVKQAPSRVARVLRKIWCGVLGACHVSMVLVVVMIVAAVGGVATVRMYLEEPVAVRERLFFDYTETNPSAVFFFGGERSFEVEKKKKRTTNNVPVGHTIHVSLMLLMPESDFNRDIGLFQLKLELLSSKGETIAKSSQPCMLQFRSLPIRLARTFVFGVPMLAGISSESQVMNIDMLRHKEKHPRARAVKVTLIPRARTSSLPQLYEAEVIINSNLPWNKRLVYNWKWTLYVWTSMYLYVALLVAILCCCRSLLFPTLGRKSRAEIMKPQELTEGMSKAREEDGREVVEMMERLRERRRSKRREISLQKALPEATASS